MLHLPAARREEERTKNQIRMHPRARPLNLSTVRFGVPLKLMNLGEIRKTNLKGRVVGKCTRCVMRFESRKRRWGAKRPPGLRRARAPTVAHLGVALACKAGCDSKPATAPKK